VEKQNVIMFDMANNYGDPSKWKESKKKPTEAFTTKGTAAKDLAKSKAKNRFASDAQTPVQDAGGNFNLRGMQTPYENFDISPGNVAQTVAKVAGPSALRTAYNSTYLLGKTVVHGSPQQGLKQIDPRLGSARFPEDKIAYGWNPTFNNNPTWTGMASREYTGPINTGATYVGKVPRNAILEDPDPGISPMVLSSKPIKVKAEIPNRPLSGYGEEFEEALKKVLRRNGVGIVPKQKIKDSVYKFKTDFKEFFQKTPPQPDF
jgi:hypothetical protein